MTWVEGDNLDLNWSKNSLTASLLEGVDGVIQTTPGYSASLVMPLTVAGLNTMFPSATTGSLYTVASGSIGGLAFKGKDGTWLFLSASEPS